jgi:hypothetical protein
VPDARRFVRQVLLPEIGATGQLRIEASTARVAAPRGAVEPPGLEHEVAERYARGAGFGAVEEGPIDVGSLAPPALVPTAAAAEVLAGARAALAAMREALREGT